MDKLDEKFATGILDDRVLSAPLRHAVSIGKRTMNKYYELSDSSDIYRMSMGTCLCCLISPSDVNVSLVLHPSYKTTYFDRLNWDKLWIEEALRITCEAWKRFKPSGNVSPNESRQPNPSVSYTSTEVSLL